MTLPKPKQYKALERITNKFDVFLLHLIYTKKHFKPIKKKVMKVILPSHLHHKKKSEILEYLANKVQYHAVMSDHYKFARQVVESGREGTDYVFEDDKEYEKKIS